MSYTGIDLVRSYLNSPFPVQSAVYDQPLVMREDDYIVFFGGAIESDSLVVKAVRSNQLSRKMITLDGDTAIVAAAPFIPDTVLVVSDSSLGSVYVEGKDYLVDYAAATLTLKDGSAILTGQNVTVWYQSYHLCDSGTDYLADLSRGALRRTASGSIGNNETVYLDYRPAFLDPQDELLGSAVREANALVEKAVDPNRQFGADPLLQGAATCRALEIVCRALATRELAGRTRDEKTALAWLKLSDNYAKRSEELLSSFRPPTSGPSAPVKS